MLLALAVPLPLLIIGLTCVIAFAGLAFLNEVWEARHATADPGCGALPRHAL